MEGEAASEAAMTGDAVRGEAVRGAAGCRDTVSGDAVNEAAVNGDDFAPFEELLAVLSKPFEDQPAYAAYADAPEPHQCVLQTFCGT